MQKRNRGISRKAFGRKKDKQDCGAWMGKDELAKEKRRSFDRKWLFSFKTTFLQAMLLITASKDVRSLSFALRGQKKTFFYYCCPKSEIFLQDYRVLIPLMLKDLPHVTSINATPTGQKDDLLNNEQPFTFFLLFYIWCLIK